MGLADRIWELPDFKKQNFFKSDLQLLIKKITEINPDCKIYVFGSIASNQAKSSSDIDLAVILGDEFDKKEFSKKFYTSSIKINRPVDIVFRNSSEFEDKKKYNVLDQVIEKHGIEIYPNWGLND